jgi:hypothetical protein
VIPADISPGVAIAVTGAALFVAIAVFVLAICVAITTEDPLPPSDDYAATTPAGERLEAEGASVEDIRAADAGWA